MNCNNIHLQSIAPPAVFSGIPPVALSDATILERKNKLLARMSDAGYDALVIYADKEHGANFEYLTGFIPRFEEGLLILNRSGQASLILGNENLKMANHCRIPAALHHCAFFSLPNQPMAQEQPLEALFSAAELGDKTKIGVVGWKMFTSSTADNRKIFDLPWFIVEALKNSLADNAVLENAAHLFISGENGARTTNNANEIAHYEYGANLASCCTLAAMNAVEPGLRESELGALLAAEGQYHTVVTIAAAGQRFEKANLYPSYKQIEAGQPLSMTTALKGGLSSRSGFVISDESQLPQRQHDYLDRVVKPYFATVASWLEAIRIGMPGGELYHLVETVLEQKKYGWHLNPGHLGADEEWMSSPVYANSAETLKSGMIVQIDIIPSVPGYSGTSCEECIALADGALQAQIQRDYPELWQRISTRRHYIINTLGIDLSDEVIPLSNTVAYLRPFLLNKQLALVCRKPHAS